jgi:hypothetical protein
VLRIHEILMGIQIWIRIRGSIPLTNESGSCYFHTKNLFAYYFLKVEGTRLHNFSKIKSHTEVTKQEESVFSYYFCLMIEGSESIFLTNGSGFGRPETYDPDPQHCILDCIKR